MIYGIGIDIIKIKRMRDADKKWGRSFFEKFL
jgi:phosphopantetheinyl transferase (holo-ACP synthase)